MTDNSHPVLASVAHVSEEFDASGYLADLDGIDITDQQKAELLATLWSIMASFVRLGFEVKICEQIFEVELKNPSAGHLRVEFNHAENSTYKSETNKRSEVGGYER